VWVRDRLRRRCRFDGGSLGNPSDAAVSLFAASAALSASGSGVSAGESGIDARWPGEPVNSSRPAWS